MEISQHFCDPAFRFSLFRPVIQYFRHNLFAVAYSSGIFRRNIHISGKFLIIAENKAVVSLSLKSSYNLLCPSFRIFRIIPSLLFPGFSVLSRSTLTLSPWRAVCVSPAGMKISSSSPPVSTKPNPRGLPIKTPSLTSPCFFRLFRFFFLIAGFSFFFTETALFLTNFFFYPRFFFCSLKLSDSFSVCEKKKHSCKYKSVSFQL